LPWRDAAPTTEAGRTAHRFAPATEALVHKQALSAFNDSADSYRLPIKGGDGPVLSPARQQTLERSFNDVLPTFVAEHRKADEGARVPFAGELTAHIATALRHSGLDARCRCGCVDASVVKIHVRPASGITLRKTIGGRSGRQRASERG
jgi:hypothetical protein